jgi:hypothetical protein
MFISLFLCLTLIKKFHSMTSPTTFRLRSRIPARFSYYRSENHFIDITLTRSNDPPLPAHRLVLAHYSGLFHSLFLSLSDLQTLRVPLDCGGCFSILLDFFYTGRLAISETAHDLCWALHVLACFYDVPDLLIFTDEEIPRIAARFSNSAPAEKVRLLTTLSVLKHFEWGSLDKDLKEAGMGRISSAFEFIVETLWGLLSERVVVPDVLRSVPPGLFVKVLKRMDATNERLVDLICAYSANQNALDTEGLQELMAVVDWDHENAHCLFKRPDLPPVDPAIARRLLAKILTRRAETAEKWEVEIGSEEMSRWRTFVWAAKISEADGGTPQEPLELLSFLRTLGGEATGISPEAMGFIVPWCSPGLAEPFSEQVLFGDGVRETPFVAAGDINGQAWVGAVFVGFSFLPSRIEVALPCSTSNSDGAKMPFHLELRCNEKAVSRVEVADYEGSVVEFEVPTPAPATTAFKISIEPYRSPIAGKIAVLRVRSLKIFGVFVK